MTLSNNGKMISRQLLSSTQPLHATGLGPNDHLATNEQQSFRYRSLDNYKNLIRTTPPPPPCQTHHSQGPCLQGHMLEIDLHLM